MIKITTPIDQVDLATNAGFLFGSRLVTKDGNEYLYLKGTTDVEKYDVCYFTTSTGSVVRLITALALNAPVGVAQGAITSNKSGWFQVYGTGWAQCDAGASSGSSLYASGTAGTISGVLLAGESVLNMIAIGDGTSTANGTVRVRMHHPYLRDVIAKL